LTLYGGNVAVARARNTAQAAKNLSNDSGRRAQTTRSERRVGYQRPPQVDQVEVEMIEFETVLISFILAAVVVIWLSH